MAKNKTKFFAKRQPKLKVETLESRQLLAGIVGAGDEVASDVTVNGVTFDQVLLNGQSVTVDPDEGQWARLTWRDAQGEIIQAEYTGDGTISVSLNAFSGAAEADRYNQPGVLYVGGIAEVTIQGSGANSSLNIYSLGGATDLVVDPNDPLNFDASLNPFLDPNETYGQADIQNLRIINDPNGAGDLFGSIGAGNVHFSGDNGLIGISAPNTDIINKVNVGGLTSTNAGVPTLSFGFTSLFGTLNMVGGGVDINGGVRDFIDDNGFDGFDVNFIDGVDASGNPDRAEIDVDNEFFNIDVEAFTLEDATEYDFTGKSQAEILDFGDDRTFTNHITFTGELPDFFEARFGELRGGATFLDDINGAVIVEGGNVGGDLVFEKGITGNGSINLNDANVDGLFRIGSADNGADLGSNLDGGIFNDIQIWGNQDGTITIDRFNSLTITGDSDAKIFSKFGGGDTLVKGDVTGGDFLESNATGIGEEAFGSFGTTTIEGDVDQDAGQNFLRILDDGTFGPISVLGGGGGNQLIGNINANAGILGTTSPAGLISIIGTADKNVTLTDVTLPGSAPSDGITIDSAGGDDTLVQFLGTVDPSLTVTGFQDALIGDDATDNVATLRGGTTITLDGSDDANLDIEGDGASGADNTVISGGFTGSGFRQFTTNDDVVIDDDLVLTAITGDADDPSSIIFADGFESGDTSAWTLSAPGELNDDGDPASGLVRIGDASIKGFTDNSLSITAAAIDIAGIITITDNLGSVSLTGDVVTTNDGRFDVAKGATDFTVDGTLTVANGTSVTFLDLADGDLNSFAVTGKSDVNDTLINLANNHDIGTLSFGEVILANGASLVSEADDIGSLTTSDDVDATGGDFINADTLGDSTIDGDLTLPDGSRLNLDGDLGNFEVTGTATLTNSSTSDLSANILAHNTGVLTFGSLIAGAGTDAAIIAANDLADTDADADPDTGSALNSIAGINVNGLVAGTAGTHQEVRASNIGPINIVGAVAEAESLVSNFNVLAAPNDHSAINAFVPTNGEIADGEIVEVVNLDGSNLSDFSIGDVTISSVLDKAFTNTAIFAGENTFSALGNLGNLSVEAGVSGAQQTRLFDDDGAESSALFSTGDGDGNPVGGDDEMPEGTFGIESTAAADAGDPTTITDPNYTDGKVTIGNISINALQTTTGANRSEVDGISSDGDATSNTDTGIAGFGVLAGVELTGESIFTTDGGGALSKAALAAVDDQVEGVVGNIDIFSNAAFGLVEDGTLANILGGASLEFSGIAAATETGKIQSSGIDLDATDEGAIIGDVDGDADTVGAGGTAENTNQVVVLVI